ncbi:hypothetical protein GQ53DRAFT_48912 [Thozetella sp. PMI_491]|nr:hypothetical protein GQ53DRAFT_48912 [Thozetella sp. PMI_491]
MASAPRRIFRVRTGCFTCRTRKKKCDETKPRCRGCERNELECRWPHSGEGVQKMASSHSVSGPPRRSGPAASHLHPTPAGGSSHAYLDEPRSGSLDSPEARPVAVHSASSPDSTASPPPSPSPSKSGSGSSTVSDGGVQAVNRGGDILDLVELPAATEETLLSGSFGLEPLGGSISLLEMVPRQLSFLPGQSGSTSYELLSHYIGVTTTSMANGSTLDNPFMTQLIPLAFSSDLVLQLILTQSAVHRASRALKSTETDQVAGQYYHRSLRLFQETINSYIGSQGIDKSLVLGVGALIMCFVETAKGDVNGSIFDHLMAAHPLLLPCLEPSSPIPKSLREFLIEYYVYTANLSMVSIDARLSPQLFLCEKLDKLARDLATSQYIGNMCGCWLELILLIPSIFDLGRRLMTNQDVPGAGPTANDFALFASLRTQILAWTPNPMVGEDVMLAGTVYQHAMLVYLHTALHPLSRPIPVSNVNTASDPGDNMQQAMIKQATSDALLALARLSPTLRINTSLCWPIAVVGSVVTDVDQKSFLLERLDHMFAAIGLGNIHQTSNLLQRIWASQGEAGFDLSESGPWDICRVMSENQIWISFA